MTDSTCHRITERLVPYADGELAADEAAGVAAHLGQCAECRSELRLLERSLELARQVWHESAAGAPEVDTPRTDRGRRTIAARRIAAAACLGVCLVIASLTAASWLAPQGRDERESAHTHAPPPEKIDVPFPQPDRNAVAAIDVGAIVAREARKARLAVAAQLLATQPGLEEYRKRADRYLVEAYGSPH
ncbi:MAG: zf-HC2 domain-containing protein [Planctomycetota bacterium]|jgi:anti-sigma factor RsiW